MIFNFCDIPSDFQIDWDTVSAQSDGERTHTHMVWGGYGRGALPGVEEERLGSKRNWGT